MHETPLTARELFPRCSSAPTTSTDFAYIQNKLTNLFSKEVRFQNE